MASSRRSSIKPELTLQSFSNLEDLDAAQEKLRQLEFKLKKELKET